ncbi:MAG TPA: cytochrome P450, partial [Gemmatimonadaceae bacterium]|nr:cytochrome P450 [Gemmatimonadaceae bacterium]
VVSSESARNLQFAHSFGSLGQIIRNVVVQRRSTHAIVPDILGMLMGSRDRESARGMSEAQIVNEIKTLIVAGHETTASTLNWLWYLLSQHAAIEDKLSDELDVISLDEAQGQDALSRLIYTRQVIEETLRLYPAGWLLTRKAIKDDSLGPYFVPAATEVYIPIYFIQRYPGHWPDPDRFSADRSASRHALAMLPFSARPRNCIGESLAGIEMQAHIMLIAKRLRLQIADSKAPELDIGVNLRSKHNFVMRPNLRPAPSTDYLQLPADAYQLRSLAGRTTSPPALH